MVGFPLFLITAFTLRGILSINFTNILLLILFHSCLTTCINSFLFFGLGLCDLTFLSNSDHKFSIGLRSGLYAGQGRILMKFSSFHSFTILAVWQGALSS